MTRKRRRRHRAGRGSKQSRFHWHPKDWPDTACGLVLGSFRIAETKDRITCKGYRQALGLKT